MIGIIGGIAYAIISQPQGLDTDTLCPKDGAKGHYVLLVDKTDPLTFTQKQAFSVVVHELIEKRIPEGYLFSVFVLGEDFRETAAPIADPPEKADTNLAEAQALGTHMVHSSPFDWEGIGHFPLHALELWSLFDEVAMT